MELLQLGGCAPSWSRVRCASFGVRGSLRTLIQRRRRTPLAQGFKPESGDQKNRCSDHKKLLMELVIKKCHRIVCLNSLMTTVVRNYNSFYEGIFFFFPPCPCGQHQYFFHLFCSTLMLFTLIGIFYLVSMNVRFIGVPHPCP